MKNLLYTTFLLLALSTFVSSQSCLPSGIKFDEQHKIDSFATNYPGCVEIEGDVVIEDNFYQSSDITNLDGLIQLTSIQGDLSIYANPVLTSLTGLDNVTSIQGDLYIYDNQALTSLTGLDNVTSIGGKVYIHNFYLTSLTGLDNVTSIGGELSIDMNPVLTSLIGLDKVTSIGGELYIGFNDALTSLTGLDNATSIGGLYIEHNDALTSLNGLDKVTSIGGELYIDVNDALTSLTGLDNVTSIGGELYISLNPVLTSLNGLDNVTSIGSNLIIQGNDALKSLSRLDNVTSIGGGLYINYNDALTSLNGIQNIDPVTIETQRFSYEDLEIHNNINLSECEVQSICDFLDLPDKTKIIEFNMTGCNSETEIEDVCNSTKVSDYNYLEHEINISPNPTKGNFILDFSATIISEAEITLFDIAGKKQLQLKKLASDRILNINSEILNSGLYILRIKSTKFGISSRKVTISN